jgi:hypothetical protein
MKGCPIRRLLLAGPVVLALWAFAGCPNQSSSFSTRFTRAHYDRVRVGMTEAQVDAIMGGKPLSREGRPFNPGSAGWEESEHKSTASAISNGCSAFLVTRFWPAGDATIEVDFENGTVYRKSWWAWLPPWKREARAWLQRLRQLSGF